MKKVLIAIDLIPCERLARELGLPYLPIKELRDSFVSRPDTELIEMLCTLPKRVPESDMSEDVIENETKFEGKKLALEMGGAKVIVCPSRRSEHTRSGFRQSDDQRLIIKTLTACMKFRPDYLFLFAGDSDFGPMVEELREEGIKTVVHFHPDMIARDVLRTAWGIADIQKILEDIRLESFPDYIPYNQY